MTNASVISSRPPASQDSLRRQSVARRQTSPRAYRQNTVHAGADDILTTTRSSSHRGIGASIIWLLPAVRPIWPSSFPGVKPAFEFCGFDVFFCELFSSLVGLRLKFLDGLNQKAYQLAVVHPIDTDLILLIGYDLRKLWPTYSATIPTSCPAPCSASQLDYTPRPWLPSTLPWTSRSVVYTLAANMRYRRKATTVALEKNICQSET